MGECQRATQARGEPYPRTCPVCGLGPCSDPQFKTARDDLVALMFKKKTERDEIAERTKILDAEIAALESTLQQIDQAGIFKRAAKALQQ